MPSVRRQAAGHVPFLLVDDSIMWIDDETRTSNLDEEVDPSCLSLGPVLIKQARPPLTGLTFGRLTLVRLLVSGRG